MIKTPGNNENVTSFKGTTVISVRKDKSVVIAADGQVTHGNIILKANSKKVRRLGNGKVIAGDGATYHHVVFNILTYPFQTLYAYTLPDN